MSHVEATASGHGTDASIPTRGTPRARWTIDIVVAVVVAALVTIGVWAELTAWPKVVVFPIGAYALGLAASGMLLA